MVVDDILGALTPEPRTLELREGFLPLRGAVTSLTVPAGPAHDACRQTLGTALRAAGATVRTKRGGSPSEFSIGSDPPSLHARPPGGADAYALEVASGGVRAAAGGPAGLLYAAMTLRQLVRLYQAAGRLPAMSISDGPELGLRGIYIEGGQERFGRIVQADYLCAQIRRLAELKMNALVIECYNLFPLPSFPACADAGTLSPEETRRVFAEAKRWHVTLIPSLQTLAQSYELVWTSDAGKPYREDTAPGMMCPSNPAVGRFAKGLYRDLLTLFDTAPLIGVGCSEIEMQWQRRYCPKCKARIDAGESERDLLLGYARGCIASVKELAAEMRRPVRPMMWADEFYMYGPGKDWVGIDTIPRDTVMGFWKYWADYSGIEGLLSRGYDVFGISAMYNHCWYLADISPADPPKSWPAMEQTGSRNIADMLRAAAAAHRAPASVLGVATASFSKHRLRAFDSIWYGFALNGHRAWSHADRPSEVAEEDFTRRYVTHAYDCRDSGSAGALAAAWVGLDRCKSRLEAANQVLHDVVGVYDTQEAGYQGNTLLDALRRCVAHSGPNGEPDERLLGIVRGAESVVAAAGIIRSSLGTLRGRVGDRAGLDDLMHAARKIELHARREILLTRTAALIARGGSSEAARDRRAAARLAAEWRRHIAAQSRIAARDRRLYVRGDPCGHNALLRDARSIADRLSDLGRGTRPSARAPLLEERFDGGLSERWIVLGSPVVADGAMVTRAPGGWERRCGIASRSEFAIGSEGGLRVRFKLTPLAVGIDSQIFASAAPDGTDSYRFSFYMPGAHFGVYTRSERRLDGPWVDTEPGWRLRAMSAPVEIGREYVAEAEIRRTSVRVRVFDSDGSDWSMPIWDSGMAPMDALPSVRFRFADVEPEGRTASTRWRSIRIERLP